MHIRNTSDRSKRSHGVRLYDSAPAGTIIPVPCRHSMPVSAHSVVGTVVIMQTASTAQSSKVSLCRDCGSLGRWPQDGMRPVKMVPRPQVCVCVIERRVAHVETRLPIFAIDIAKSGQKRRHFFEKVAEQGLSGHCRSGGS